MEEKHSQAEHRESYSLDADILQDVSPEEQKRIVRRIDSRLLTTVGALYTVSLIDRTNLSAAAIAGMLQDLRLISNRYVKIFSLDGGMQKLTCPVNHHSGFLYYIYRFPTTFSHNYQKNWPSHPSIANCLLLGRCYDRDGFRPKVARNGGSSGDIGNP